MRNLQQEQYSNGRFVGNPPTTSNTTTTMPLFERRVSTHSYEYNSEDSSSSSSGSSSSQSSTSNNGIGMTNSSNNTNMIDKRNSNSNSNNHNNNYHHHHRYSETTNPNPKQQHQMNDAQQLLYAPQLYNHSIYDDHNNSNNNHHHYRKSASLSLSSSDVVDTNKPSDLLHQRNSGSNYHHRTTSYDYDAAETLHDNNNYNDSTRHRHSNNSTSIKSTRTSTSKTTTTATNATTATKDTIVATTDRRNNSGSDKVTTTTTTNTKKNNHHRTTIKTIAIFGVGSKTSIHFIRRALNAGYHVRAMIIHQSTTTLTTTTTNTAAASAVSENVLFPPDVRVHTIASELRKEFSIQEGMGILHWIRADCLYDPNAIQRTIQNATYVVCMMQEPNTPISSFGCNTLLEQNDSMNHHHHHQYNPNNKKFYIPPPPKPPSSTTMILDPYHEDKRVNPQKPITSFLQLLYPIMKQEASIQLFLYQANSVTADIKGKTPIYSKALKTITTVRNLLLPRGGIGGGQQQQQQQKKQILNFTNPTCYSDHNAAIKEMARHHPRRSHYHHHIRNYNISTNSASTGNHHRTSLGDISNCTGTSVNSNQHHSTVSSNIVDLNNNNNKNTISEYDNRKRSVTFDKLSSYMSDNEMKDGSSSSGSSNTYQYVTEKTMQRQQQQSQQSLAHFAYIITRPTTFMMKDNYGAGTSSSTKNNVSASKSQPGPFPITHSDLAEFTLNAMINRKLYNSCPYVVGTLSIPGMNSISSSCSGGKSGGKIIN